MKNYRRSPTMTPAKILKQQRRESRMQLKLERHFRGKANVPTAPVNPTPVFAYKRREGEVIGNPVIVGMKHEFLVRGTKKNRTDRVGVEVVGINTGSRLREVDPEIPAYLTPVVLDVQLRRGSAWESVKSLRELDWNDRVLIGPRLKDRSFITNVQPTQVVRQLVGPRHEDGSFVKWELRFNTSINSVIEKVEAGDHPVTVLKPRSRGGKQRRGIKLRERFPWCPNCNDYRVRKHDCLAVAAT